MPYRRAPVGFVHHALCLGDTSFGGTLANPESPSGAGHSNHVPQSRVRSSFTLLILVAHSGSARIGWTMHAYSCTIMSRRTDMVYTSTVAPSSIFTDVGLKRPTASMPSTRTLRRVVGGSIASASTIDDTGTIPSNA